MNYGMKLDNLHMHSNYFTMPWEAQAGNQIAIADNSLIS